MPFVGKKALWGEEHHLSDEARPGDVVPSDVAFMGLQAETMKQRPEVMALAHVSRKHKTGIWLMAMGRKKVKGVSSEKLKHILTQIRARARALSISNSALVLKILLGSNQDTSLSDYIRGPIILRYNNTESAHEARN